MEKLIKEILKNIGENPEREGLKDTPKRVAKMYKEIFRGYDNSQKPIITTFPNGQDGIVCDQMVCDTGYFFSHCEHHIVPFFGKYYFAYIPDKTILGLSKVARIIDFHSAKLQVQERLVTDVVNDLERACSPQGIALVLSGRHLCKEMRGVKKFNGEMVTSDVRGLFREDPSAKKEFLSLINTVIN